MRGGGKQGEEGNVDGERRVTEDEEGGAGGACGPRLLCDDLLQTGSAKGTLKRPPLHQGTQSVFTCSSSALQRTRGYYLPALCHTFTGYFIKNTNFNKNRSEGLLPRPHAYVRLICNSRWGGCGGVPEEVWGNYFLKGVFEGWMGAEGRVGRVPTFLTIMTGHVFYIYKYRRIHF